MPQTIPRYRLLADALQQQIDAGELEVGDQLPTEHELMARYNVARNTVREALRHLKGLGLIASRQGSGSVVKAQQAQQVLSASVGSLEELLQYASQTKLVNLSFKEVIADGELAERLGCPVGMQWLYLQAIRVRTKDSKAVAWTEMYISYLYSAVRSEIARNRGSLAKLIERRFGIALSEVINEVSARSMPPAIAKQLQLPAGSAALYIKRRYLGSDGKTFLVAFSLTPGDQHTMTLRFRSQGF